MISIVTPSKLEMSLAKQRVFPPFISHHLPLNLPLGATHFDVCRKCDKPSGQSLPSFMRYKGNDPAGNKIMIRSLVGNQLILNLMAERSTEHIPWRSQKDGRETVGYKPSRTSVQ
jgi:hypothetical protein